VLAGVVLVGGTATGVVWSGFVSREQTATIPPPETSLETVNTPATHLDVSPAEPVRPALPIASDAREHAPRSPTRAETPGTLSRESSLLVAARAKLRQGDTAGASTSLRELDQHVPHGKLTQEREVLRIELLAAKGDHAGAARRAEAFLAAHPTSPHAARLARFAR
jgi:hypothetical protein